MITRARKLLSPKQSVAVVSPSIEQVVSQGVRRAPMLLKRKISPFLLYFSHHVSHIAHVHILLGKFYEVILSFLKSSLIWWSYE